MSVAGPDTEALATRLGAYQGNVLEIEVDPHVEYATVDTIRHFAHGYGDDNPLFTSPEYARTSVFGEPVAPPLFPLATGTPAAVPASVDAMNAIRELRELPVRVWHDRWTLHRPVTLGTRLERTDSVGDVTYDANSGAIFVATRSRYSAGEDLFAEHVRVRRYGPVSDTTGPRREVARYDPDDIERIDAAYAAETRRGANTRTAAEVAPGDALGPVVRGPLTMTDLIEYRAGVGRGPFGAGALRLGYLNRRRLPSFYDRDGRGAYDARERCHWDADYARSLEHPNAYDYSHTRLTWLAHLVTDWAGDGAWLHTITFREHAPNYVGDTHRLTGTVAAVTPLPGAEAAFVELSLEATNQLGITTCRADAIVLLPEDRGRCVELPLPDGGATVLEGAVHG